MANAEQLLERMRNTKSGWGQRDFRKLYEGFGFERDEDGPHTVYLHKETGLRASVGRHNSLATGYAVTAVKIIDALLAARRTAADTNEDD